MRKKHWIVIGSVLIVSILAVTCVRLASAQDCPTVEALKAYRPPEATRVYARDGSLIADLSPQRRVVVELNEVPRVLREGFVAVEDKRFWQHGGIDPQGIARAVWRDVKSLSLREGFSTITMQLARQVFTEELPMSEKFRRKTCEVFLARRIEKEFSKREILKLYLNQVTMGGGLYGVEAASQNLFGKPAARVSPAEAALLVGLVKNPEGYNPRKEPLRAIQRRNVVLAVMAREDVISSAEAERAKAEPLRLAPPPEAAGPAPYFVIAIRKDLEKHFGPEADISGLRVYTGLDPELQQAARQALVDHLKKIETGTYGKYRHPVPAADGKLAPAGGASPYLQGLVVALDTRTGLVRALVGGRDFAHSQFDRAFQARRQPGSAFKPVVYAAALNQGLPITTRMETAPVVFADGSSPPWSPEDHVSASVPTLSLREALAKSSNNVAVRVGQWAGVERVVEMARTLGLTTKIPPYPSVILGAADVIPVELVAAYATFGNGGYRVRPQLIERVEDKRGRVLWRASNTPQRVLDEGVAYLTLSLMEDVIDHGTGATVRSAGFWLPAAGKTGTTNAVKDTWFIGMTPDLVAGVWVGFDQPKTILPNGSGSRFAAPVWGVFMREAYSNRPSSGGWVPPASLVSIPVDTASGLPATSNCPPPQVRIEYFLPGTEPQDYCRLHPETSPEKIFDRLWRGFRKIF